MSAATNSTPAPPQAEETGPLTASSATSSSGIPPSRLESFETTVADLREQLVAVQEKLERALKLKGSQAGGLHDKNAGYVDVDFVRTKPSKRGKMRCKTVNVKTILHNFHAEFPEGCVTALMGPSGAGKTTLLDFLTGMLGDSVHASGQVALPDNDAYVPQDDRLHGFYSCQMYMEHYGRLTGMIPLLDCCNKNTSQGGSIIEEDNHDIDEEGGGISQSTDTLAAGKDTQNVHKLIDNILSEVGLTAQTNTVVGGMFKRGLSGGQKRRLSVALEALSSPLNLFLDEPTSGLDSESALALMKYLQSYARGKDPITGRRRRVIVTIHQPSSQIWEELIDNVVLLAAGRLMYQGPRKEMDDFFGAYGHPVPVHYNPADHFIEVLFKMPHIDDDGEEVEEMSEDLSTSEMWSICFKKWSRNEEDTFKENANERSRSTMNEQKSTVIRRDPSMRRRSKVKAATRKNNRSAIELTRRSFVSLLKNPIVLCLRMAIYGGMSLMIGILFFDLESKTDLHSVQLSRTALLYFIIAFCSSMSVAVIPFAMVDRSIVQKEVRNHLYHPAFYHWSQALAGIPVCLILSLVVSVIILGMTRIHGGAGFSLILFLTFLCADATSMFVSHIAPELISAICIASGIFGVFTMVMGFLVTPSKMPEGTGWLYYIPFMTYSFRSLMYIEYSQLDLGYNEDTVEQLEQQIEMLNVTEPEFELDGTLFLKNFEMEHVNVRQDMVILVVWAGIMHIISLVYLCWSHYKSRRMFIYSDGE